jgi:D-amino-acid dehydrogenase
MKRNVTVIGAGIVGISCASYLQRDGHQVTVIDRLEPGEGCSFGNAGGMSPGSCVPVAMPGVAKQIPRWLMDPLGPLAIRWSYLLPALPWLLRFMRAGRREEVERIATGIRALLEDVFDNYAPLLKAAGAEHLVHSRAGQMYVWRTRGAFDGDQYGLKLRRDRGVTIDVLDQHEIRQREPALAPIFEVGAVFPQHGHCSNPFRLVRMLAEQFQRNGGAILKRSVTGFERDGDRVTGVATDAGAVNSDDVVIAAGAWSARLAKQLGANIPLETQRGYHVTVADPGVAPRINVMWADAKFMATPMEMGLRFAGTVELAGLEAAPDYRRARKLLELGRTMYPGLKDATVTEWMGHRPCTPDTLPVIDRASGHRDVVFAFGHGHTGLSGASTTGKLVAEMVGGRPASIDLSPYRADRF